MLKLLFLPTWLIGRVFSWLDVSEPFTLDEWVDGVDLYETLFNVIVWVWLIITFNKVF